MILFYKVLSNVLHPAILPCIGAGVYLVVLPLPLSPMQKYLIFAIVFGATFVIPLLTLFLLKAMGYVKTNNANTIQERKLPVSLMFINYLFLAQILKEIIQLRELTILAYTTALGLLVIRLLFYVNIKASLHMLGMAGLLGFTLIYGVNYGYSNGIIALQIALLGALATARLQLKAHNIRELFIGVSLGLFVPIVLNLFL